MTQHSTLSPERWAAFTLNQQILMIANEMNRASRLFGSDDRARLGRGYERVLRLCDLTVIVNPRRSLRRELLRWRDLVAQLYVEEAPDPIAHDAAFRVLLQLTPASYQQIPFVQWAAQRRPSA